MGLTGRSRFRFSYIMAGIAVLALGYGFFHVERTLKAQRNAAHRELEELQKRLSAVELLCRAADRDQNPSVAPALSAEAGRSQLGADWERFARRLEVLEQRVDEIGSYAPVGQQDWVADGRSHSEGMLEALLRRTAIEDAKSSLDGAYSSETQISEWGARTAGMLDQAFAASGFFSRYGGRVDIGCKETTCRIAWPIMNMADRSDAEYDQSLALAEYELMALAAKSGEQVGRLETTQTNDDGVPTVVLYFSRKSQK